jgi:hypothetical protein
MKATSRIQLCVEAWIANSKINYLILLRIIQAIFKNEHIWFYVPFFFFLISYYKNLASFHSALGNICRVAG